MKFRSASVPVVYRIKGSTKTFLVAFAILADGIQTLLTLLAFTLVLIPLSYILSLFLTLTLMSVYGMVFSSHGVHLLSGKHLGKKMTLFAGTFIAEFLPIINQITPTLTFWTIATIRQSRVEDIETASVNAKIAEAQRQTDMKIKARMRARREQSANDNAIASQRGVA